MAKLDDAVAIDADVRDYSALVAEMAEKNVSTLIHAAAIAGSVACDKDVDTAIATNVNGTKNAVSACKQLGAKLVFFSSSVVYGNNQELLTEKSRLAPVTLYGVTKVLGEMVVDCDLPGSLIIRPCMCYSPNQEYYLLLFQSFLVEYSNYLLRGKEGVLGTSRKALLLSIPSPYSC
jgi:dTDP-4-dehydrorhamnose reductase